MGDDARESIRQDLELFWDTKLHRARERYFRAATNLCQLVLQRENESPALDSVVAGARREEAEAFADYCRILATYTELVAIGTLPRGARTNIFQIPRNSD